MGRCRIALAPVGNAHVIACGRRQRIPLAAFGRRAVHFAGRKMRDLLTTYIQTTRAEARAVCVSRVGWHGDLFVLPGTSSGPYGAEAVFFQTPHEAEHLTEVSGTL